MSHLLLRPTNTARNHFDRQWHENNFNVRRGETLWNHFHSQSSIGLLHSKHTRTFVHKMVMGHGIAVLEKRVIWESEEEGDDESNDLIIYLLTNLKHNNTE